MRVLHLSRNFGHQAAVQAGLAHAEGDAVVVMDADMQDDPASIGRFLQKWREGYDVVYAVRVGRKESAAKRFLFFAFYRLLNLIVRVPMPADAGNFGLIDRRVADEIVRLLDRDRYYAGLRSWVGFRQVGIEVERGPRYDGRPRVSMLGLWRLAKSAIFSFSSFPLTFFYLVGSLSMLVFLGLAGFTLYPQAVHRAGDPRLDVDHDVDQLLRRHERDGHRRARRVRHEDLRAGPRPADVPRRAPGQFPRRRPRRRRDRGPLAGPGALTRRGAPVWRPVVGIC